MPPQPAPGFGQGGLVPQSHTLMQSNETASAVLAAQARAVIEARYLIAINRPRDLDVVREKLLKECRRPGFAEVAIYKKPIGKGVEGLSIRFAEAAIRYMCNIDISQQTIYDDAEKRIIRVSCTDMETNTPYPRTSRSRKRSSAGALKTATRSSANARTRAATTCTSSSRPRTTS